MISIFGFGTFGVPIKSEAANKVNVDPLVMQTYKSLVCFASSWLVLALGQPFSYTPWGILSALFWVPGGIAVIFSIRNAGLALTVGINGSLIVLVSFTWGIFVFGEEVHSVVGACTAVAIMCLGIAGMSFSSSPHLQLTPKQFKYMDLSLSHAESQSSSSLYDNVSQHLQEMEIATTNQVIDSQNVATSTGKQVRKRPSLSNLDSNVLKLEEIAHHHNHEKQTYLQPTQTFILPFRTHNLGVEEINHFVQIIDPMSRINFMGGLSFTRRQLGIACSVFNGVWGGSIMVPMHFSSAETGGLGYSISFGVGAMIVTLSLWFLRWCIYLLLWRGNPMMAYNALPSMHLRELWWAGGLCGIFWSIGNLGSIVAVDILGEGVGYSSCQAALLVSGLWGIFWFGEIRGWITILSWIASACLTIAGLLMLSYEHVDKVV